MIGFRKDVLSSSGLKTNCETRDFKNFQKFHHRNPAIQIEIYSRIFYVILISLQLIMGLRSVNF